MSVKSIQRGPFVQRGLVDVQVDKSLKGIVKRTLFRTDTFTHLPKSLLLLVGEFSDKVDILILIKTCKVLGSIFKSSSNANPIEGVAKLQFGTKSALFEQDPDSAQIAYSKSSMSICAETGPAQKSSNLVSKASVATPSIVQILLAQVTNRRSITSMKALFKQVEDLKRHCSHVLEKGKTWNLVEVLKRAKIDTIDFSQEKATRAEMKALMDAFEEIRKTTQPKEVINIERQVRDEGIVSVIEAFTDDERDEFIEFSNFLSSEHEDIQNLTDVGKHTEIYGFIDKVFLKTTPLKLAGILQDFLKLKNSNLVLFKESCTQDIFGDIREFRSSACEANVEFFRFLRTFCPRLQKLMIAYTSIEDEKAIYRFFSAPERRDSLIDLEFWNKNSNNLRVLDVLAPEKEYVDFLVNQSKLEGFKSFRFLILSTLKRVVDNCPKLTTLKINTEVRGNEQKTEYILNVFKKIAGQCSNIHHLDLKCDLRNPTLQALIKKIVEKNKKLRSLVINSSHEYDACLKGILAVCPALESFSTVHLATSFFALLPSAFPRLKSMDISTSLSNTEIFRLLLQSPHLVEIPSWIFYREELVVDVRNILQVRRLNLLVKQENCPGRAVFAELQMWDAVLIAELHRLVWVHNGAPDIPEYGRRALEQDVELLKSTKPILSLHGNLLEQLSYKICIEAMARQVHDELYPYVFFTEMMKGNYIAHPDPALARALQIEVERALVVKHGNKGDGVVYFSDAMCQNNIEDLAFMFRLLNKEIQMKRSSLREIQADYQKNRLQAFNILLSDETMHEKQLLEVYRFLDKDLQDTLAHRVWQASGCPDEQRFGEKQIYKNVRCLATVLQDLIVPH